LTTGAADSLRGWSLALPSDEDADSISAEGSPPETSPSNNVTVLRGEGGKPPRGYPEPLGGFASAFSDDLFS